jgi:hypothetical protein
MKKTHLFGTMLLAFGAMVFTACNNENPIVEDVNAPYVPGIPMDDIATPNPELDLTELNTVIPNLNYTVDDVNGWAVIRLDLTGVKDPYTNDWVKLYGPGSTQGKQNVWLSLDGKPKGFSLYNTIDDADDKELSAVDIVFLVDNSGSMGEEANAIAEDIKSWADELGGTLDVQFGCVGYDGAITGAINITTADKLKEYLDYSSGTGRTYHFGGPDADELKSKVGPYATGGGSWNECGTAALRFADENFSFRPGANRVYVNFTDEPNQPGGKADYSTLWVKENWKSTQGTIHTIYSDGTWWANNYMNYVDKDYPWDLSIYTDGTMLFTSSNFIDINGNRIKLSDLPVSGALLNSYIIKFTNCEEVFDGQPHNVKITVKSESPNGEILADKEFNMVFNKE